MGLCDVFPLQFCKVVGSERNHSFLQTAWLFFFLEYQLTLDCRYEETVYADWTKDVGSVSQENLDKPLLVRDGNTKLIKVNFDPQVCLA